MIIDLEIKFYANLGSLISMHIQAIKVAPGLAVHICPKEADCGWNITHINSGLAVVQHMPSRTAAKQLALKLAEVVDWSEFEGSSTKEWAWTKKQYKRAMRLIATYGP